MTKEEAPMEIFKSLKEALEKYPDAHVQFEEMGNCKVCGIHEDLRMGACYDCCDNVDGEPIEGGDRLWQIDKPENTWYVKGH